MSLHGSAIGQAAQPLPREHWSALWISHPSAPLREPLTLHFRRTFEAPANSRHFLIHVSADNRFILYLNGQRVGAGPARGDLGHWRYETFDLGPLLSPGKNTLSATVWNLGIFAPVAQMSDRTAFLVEGDTAAESIVNTGDQWRVKIEAGLLAYPREPRGYWQYMATGAGEKLQSSDFDWNWQTEDTSGNGWVPASSAIRESIYPQSGIAVSRGFGSGNPWLLVPDNLPPMTYSPDDAGALVRREPKVIAGLPQQTIVIPANAHVHLLFARQTLMTGYPHLTFSGGKGGSIELTYAEALFDEHQKKGDRDEVGSRQALGARDLVLPDGGSKRVFEPLWWRTWRYLDLDIQTATQLLTLDSLTAASSFYPFQQVADFRSSDEAFNRIWKIGWHTVQLDAHETFMDTPSYEQLQYVGDTRIEAMITYAVTADGRLPRQAIRAFDDSRTADGLTASRYPSAIPQRIPTFSLLWIGMLRDYALYRDDAATVREALPGTRTVLDWFKDYRQKNGLLSKLPDWSFVDWTSENRPLPSYDSKGQSCLVTLQYVGALEDAKSLEASFGDAERASAYAWEIERVKAGVLRLCWNPSLHLLADSPAKDAYSQQTNALGVLYDVIPKTQQRQVLETILVVGPDTPQPSNALTITPASYYFQYYVARALVHAGLEDRYFKLLDIWRSLLDRHFTTWPESPGDTRSDSHAWSAHPTFDLLTIVAGIRSASNGFSRVSIRPHLGMLTDLEASVAHDGGPIQVRYHVEGTSLTGSVELPPHLTGDLQWKGQYIALHEGKNVIHLK